MARDTKRYSLMVKEGICELSSRVGSPFLVYKFPYEALKDRKDPFNIKNNFIIYILHSRSAHGKDKIYVGKSINGLKDRPISHDDKHDNWETCYILTTIRERTFLNDGTVKYIEDRYRSIINETGWYDNTTKRTNFGTANDDDEMDCEEFIDGTLDMLWYLGLDLTTKRKKTGEVIATIDEDEICGVVLDDEAGDEAAADLIAMLVSMCDEQGRIPIYSDRNGIHTDGYLYWDEAKQFFKNKNRRNINCVVRAGSAVDYIRDYWSDRPHQGQYQNRVELEENGTIVNDKFTKDVEFPSLSRALAVVHGRPIDGPGNWKLKNGTKLKEVLNII